MRRLLGTLPVLLLLTLAGCGDRTGHTDGGLQPEPEPTPQLVSGTAGGGEVEASATALPDDDAVRAYVGRFDDSFAQKVDRAAGSMDVAEDQVLIAQVVALGCDVPPGATVRGRVIVPAKVASPMMECLAPVTTVALAAVPAEDGS